MSTLSTESTRIALLGTGGMAATHIQAYSAMPDVTVATVFSRRLARAAEFASGTGATPADDFATILGDRSIDAVDVCLPTPEHAPFVLAALEAGKHVFCETPLTLDLGDALAMRDAARRTRRALQVGLLVRSISSYAEIRRQFVAGLLGAPVAASAYRLGSYLRPEASDHKPHYSDPTTELMTFDFDALNWIFGLPEGVSAVAASSVADGTPGHVFATLQYDGFAASVEASGLMPASFPFQLGMRVTGTLAAIEMTAKFAEEGPPESTLDGYPAVGSTAPIVIEEADPYEVECRRFIDCIRGTADSELLDVERAIEALRVSLATQEAIKSHAFVRVK